MSIPPHHAPYSEDFPSLPHGGGLILKASFFHFNFMGQRYRLRRLIPRRSWQAGILPLSLVPHALLL